MRKTPIPRPRSKRTVTPTPVVLDRVLDAIEDADGLEGGLVLLKLWRGNDYGLQQRFRDYEDFVVSLVQHAEDEGR
jgi:hypothetical protein